jgi:diguanylate cyclase (GGDEF)-like protein/PAS domain S-box-containing protein
LRYQALFDRSNDAVFIIDFDQVFRAANQKTSEFLGYEQDELIGMSIQDIIAPEEHQLSQERAKSVIAGDIPPIYERTFVRKDGTRVVGEISASIVYDATGEPQFIQSFVRDITERREAEQALWESENRYRALFNQTNDGITLIDLDGVVIDVNLRAAEILGYTVEEMIGRKIKEFSVAEEAQDTSNVVHRIISGDMLPVYERTLKKKDGSLVPTEVNVTIVVDRDGNPLYIQSITRDITERKQAEERLKHLSTHDRLTSLPNRSLLYNRLERSIARGERYNRKLAVLFLDLDGFKAVNDTLGHAAGDRLLIDVGDRLRSCVRESDTVARMGGDEFILILDEIVDVKHARTSVQRILEVIDRPYHLDGQEVNITASIGVSVFPIHGEDAETLITLADRAMYISKDKGKERYTICNEQ